MRHVIVNGITPIQDDAAGAWVPGGPSRTSREVVGLVSVRSNANSALVAHLGNRLLQDPRRDQAGAPDCLVERNYSVRVALRRCSCSVPAWASPKESLVGGSDCR